MKVFEIVAVYDNLTESFLQPTFVPTLAEAQRIFEYQINSIPLWKANASDYDLYSLGTYNAEEGSFISLKHKICKGPAVLRKEKNLNDIQSAEQTSEIYDTSRDYIPE